MGARRARQRLVGPGGLRAVAAAASIAMLSCAAAPAAAQAPAAPLRVQISTGVTPDTVTVGDPFQALVRVTGAEGTRVEFPELEELPESVQALAPVRVVADPEVPGAALAVYSIVAWSTGALVVPSVPVLVEHPDGTAEIYRVGLRLPWVESVLPPEPAEVEPRGAKDVLDAEQPGLSRALLLALALLLLAVIGYLLWRRRRARPAAAEPHEELSPRAQALAALERARALGPAEGAAWKPFFSLVSNALRGYLAALSPRWSADLTTRELLQTLEADGVDPVHLDRLGGVLHTADRVKFARYHPSAAEARATWESAHEWVRSAEPIATGARPTERQEAA